jgi:asparagine synthetase B (glutamine-hydrolysing)
MAASVEARVPFLDHSLLSYAFYMPDKYKYQKGITKYILKKVAERYLPSSLIYRPKVGFTAPAKQWFAEGLYFKKNLVHLINQKKKMWEPYLHMDYIHHLATAPSYKQPYDITAALWGLHSILASDIELS